VSSAMTDKQASTYERFRELGYEYSLTEPTGAIRMIRYERGQEYTRKLAEIAIDPGGTWDDITEETRHE
jgi:hypothetical protein